MRLDNALRELGYDGEADQFRDAVLELFQATYPAWSDEALLHNPAQAQRFCEQVRLRCHIGCSDELILRTLTNT